jgi:hypothetical protein
LQTSNKVIFILLAQTTKFLCSLIGKSDHDHEPVYVLGHVSRRAPLE